MIYWLHPEALGDLRDAASYYREHVNSSFSMLMLAEFEHSVELLLRHPHAGSLWRHGKRQLIMRRFPYCIFYTADDDQIRIFAISHHSRRPGYWGKRK